MSNCIFLGGLKKTKKVINSTPQSPHIVLDSIYFTTYSGGLVINSTPLKIAIVRSIALGGAPWRSIALGGNKLVGPFLYTYFLLQLFLPLILVSLSVSYSSVCCLLSVPYFPAVSSISVPLFPVCLSSLSYLSSSHFLVFLFSRLLILEVLP